MGVCVDLLDRHVQVGRLDECWPWTRYVGDHGYGILPLGWEGASVGAHIAAFVVAHGPLSEDDVVDHLCHNRDLTCRGGSGCVHRRCCNPWHLRATDHGTNIAAGRAVTSRRRKRDARTECAHGHPLDAVNRIVDARGNLSCRRCKREWARAKAGSKPTGPLRTVVGRQGRYDTLDCGHTLRRSSSRTSVRRACSDCEVGVSRRPATARR